MAEDVDVDATTKAKEKVKGNPKGSQKERKETRAIPKERKEAVQRWRTGNAQTAMSLAIGPRIVPTW